MSHPQNTQFIESAYERFDEAVAQGEYHTALNVITDVRVNGFATEAQTLRDLLRAVPLERFARKSPYME